MTLREKQSKFSMMVAKLIIHAYKMGYEVTLGDAYRDPRTNGKQGVKKGYGRSVSAHKNRLAIDLNLFYEGRYLTRTKDHRALGEFWETLGGTWGGRFKSGSDGNHYSYDHNGVK